MKVRMEDTPSIPCCQRDGSMVHSETDWEKRWEQGLLQLNNS